MPRGRPRRDKPDPVDVDLGWNIRRVRQQAGISLERVAQQLDLSFQTLQRYETGLTRISASMLIRIAGVLEVPVAKLLIGIAVNGSGSAAVGDPDEEQALEIARELLAIPDPAVRHSLRLHLQALARADREAPET
ncbi:helix-turn-helix domain-containing protein [Inquilinus sp. Marseille-Q2685]|uniref:helix-turn-helix domain-containing protein n=1 Tax=Inquilinus sp. Marseille-Q2685 TaxID=2866581 RepID=UPI001CE3EE60|nr:helix-turn-helix transcriptional regulator [Inquilinus sp. Marseille-Q2685]